MVLSGPISVTHTYSIYTYYPITLFISNWKKQGFLLGHDNISPGPQKPHRPQWVKMQETVSAGIEEGWSLVRLWLGHISLSLLGIPVFHLVDRNPVFHRLILSPQAVRSGWRITSLSCFTEETGTVGLYGLRWDIFIKCVLCWELEFTWNWLYFPGDGEGANVSAFCRGGEGGKSYLLPRLHWSDRNLRGALQMIER